MGFFVVQYNKGGRMKINRLSLIQKLSKRTKDNHFLALWKCDCGKTKEIIFTRVVNGYTKSCGCLVNESKHNFVHGYKGSPTYSSWSAAKFRCNNKRSKDYKNYGGAGITFYEPWAKSFERFLKDMGERPPNTTLDRIDCNKGYEPGNCRWATRNEQQQNKKSSYVWEIEGKIFETAKEAADFHSVTVQSITRWVCGYFDQRRNSHKPPKPNCFRRKRYTNERA
jgi:hypothetical protein